MSSCKGERRKFLWCCVFGSQRLDKCCWPTVIGWCWVGFEQMSGGLKITVPESPGSSRNGAFCAVSYPDGRWRFYLIDWGLQKLGREPTAKFGSPGAVTKTCQNTLTYKEGARNTVDNDLAKVKGTDPPCVELAARLDRSEWFLEAFDAAVPSLQVDVAHAGTVELELERIASKVS